MDKAPALAVAVCQFAPTADPAANRERIAEFTADAAARGAQLVVFPEYSSYFVDPMDASLVANAETLDGEFVTSLIAIARAHAVTIVAGLVEAGDSAAEGSARVRNALVVVDGTRLVAVYRKQHLYDAFGQKESDWIEAGDTGPAQIVEVGGLRLGLMTCYDLRFPEVARMLVDAGAEAFVVPAEWVRGPLKEHHWGTLLAARAIENTAYVVAADHPAGIGIGQSRIVDPEGVTIAGIGRGEGIAIATLEREVVNRVRQTNPVLRLRRYAVTAR